MLWSVDRSVSRYLSPDPNFMGKIPPKIVRWIKEKL